MFCFIFHVYDEVEQSKILVQSLRRFYPNVQIISIFDGLKNSELKQYLESFQVMVVEGDRLKLQKNGAAWLVRMLEKFLELSSAEALIKIEPDSLVLREFKEFPLSSAGITGTLVETSCLQYITSGCFWIRRSAVQRILNSKILLDNRYKILRSFGYKKQPDEQEWLLNENIVLAQVSSVLNLGQENWKEVCCNVLPIEEATNEWAVFHPLKYQTTSKPVEPISTIPSLASAKVKKQQQIIDLAAKKQQQLVATYPEQEQKSWEGPEGKVAEARAILLEGINVAKSIRTEAIASFKPTSEAEIEAATIALARIIVQKTEELRHALGFIAGTRARKYKEVEALTELDAVLAYKVEEGWSL